MKQSTFKSVIAGNAVTVGATPVYVGGDNSMPAPKVALVRNGDCITAVKIQCGCGQVIVLDCAYDPVTPSPATLES